MKSDHAIYIQIARLSKEVNALKNMVMKKNQALAKKGTSLGGLKGANITEKDIRNAKHSLFGTHSV